MNKLNYAILAAAVLMTGQAQASVNLLTNGDFNSSDTTGLTTNGSPGNPQFWTVKNGQTNITGWTVGGDTVDLIKGGYGAIDEYSVDLAGTPGPGSISQSFDIFQGWTYTLNFDMSSNGYNQAKLTFGSNVETVTLDGISTHFTRSFVAATTGKSIVSFDSIVGGNSGAVIDNVTVTAVPEPETYAMLLAGLGLVGWTVQRRRRIAG